MKRDLNYPINWKTKITITKKRKNYSNSFRIFKWEKRSIIFQRSETINTFRLDEPHGLKFRWTIKRQHYFEIAQYTSLIERLPGASHDISLTGSRLWICVTCGDREPESSLRTKRCSTQLDSETYMQEQKEGTRWKRKRQTNGSRRIV